MKSIKRTIPVILISLITFYSFGQKLPIIDTLRNNRIANVTVETNTAEIVVEGRGLNNAWDNEFYGKQGDVFTSWRIKVLKVFKGNIKDSILEIISDGGADYAHGSMIETTWGGVGKGEEGLFFLRFNNTGIESGKGYQSCVFIGHNSWLRYNKFPSSFRAITHVDSYQINDLDKDLYPLIIAATHKPPVIFSPNSIEIYERDNYDRIHNDTLITRPDGRRVYIPKKDLK